MLIKHKISRLEPTSKRYLFIELNVEDFRCRNSIAKRVLNIASKLDGFRRGNVIRIPRSEITDSILKQLTHLDRISTKYKQCLIRHNFNYAYRNLDGNYHRQGAFRRI